jgi:hypothetical protein
VEQAIVLLHGVYWWLALYLALDVGNEVLKQYAARL